MFTGFSVSFFCGSFFLGALRSARLCSVVVSAAVMSFCRSWVLFSLSFFLVSILRSSWMRYSSSATCRPEHVRAVREQRRPGKARGPSTDSSSALGQPGNDFMLLPNFLDL